MTKHESFVGASDVILTLLPHWNMAKHCCQALQDHCQSFSFTCTDAFRVCSDANATTGVVLGFGGDGISKHPNTVIT